MLMIEDDPYFFVQFVKTQDIDLSKTLTKSELAVYFNSYLTKSFFSMDTEGRVLRLDSFSKLLTGGARIGWITAPKSILRKFELIQQIDSVHASGIGQAIVQELLRKWGVEGFGNHVKDIAQFYVQKRDYMNSCLDKYGASAIEGLEWSLPLGGFFFWLKTPLKDTGKLLKKYVTTKKLLFVAGNAFVLDEEASCFIRLSYSCVTEEQIDIGIKRLVDIIQEELSELKKHVQLPKD